MSEAYRRAAVELVREVLTPPRDADAPPPEPLRLEVKGWCMEPLLVDGDRVWVEPLAGPPRVGQLLLARTADDRLVCHRALAQEGDRWSLAGDRSLRLEQHARDDLLGRLAAVERQGQRHPLPLANRFDVLLARWHHVAWRWRSSLGGRLLEALRWRLVALRARRWWRAALDARP